MEDPASLPQDPLENEKPVETAQEIVKQERPAQSPLYTSSTCRRCRQSVKPCPDSMPNWKTHLIAGVLFLIGLPFFCFLPYCFDMFGTPVSRCPKCGAFMD